MLLQQRNGLVAQPAFAVALLRATRLLNFLPRFGAFAELLFAFAVVGTGRRRGRNHYDRGLLRSRACPGILRGKLAWRDQRSNAYQQPNRPHSAPPFAAPTAILPQRFASRARHFH